MPTLRRTRYSTLHRALAPAVRTLLFSSLVAAHTGLVCSCHTPSCVTLTTSCALQTTYRVMVRPCLARKVFQRFARAKWAAHQKRDPEALAEFNKSIQGITFPLDIITCRLRSSISMPYRPHSSSNTTSPLFKLLLLVQASNPTWGYALLMRSALLVGARHSGQHTRAPSRARFRRGRRARAIR
jgi:hypothetical protein